MHKKYKVEMKACMFLWSKITQHGVVTIYSATAGWHFFWFLADDYDNDDDVRMEHNNVFLFDLNRFTLLLTHIYNK